MNINYGKIEVNARMYLEEEKQNSWIHRCFENSHLNVKQPKAIFDWFIPGTVITR